jgi:hypothetical protein
MTYRRSPPRPSSGNRARRGAGPAALVLLAALAGPALGADDALVQRRDGVEVDWAAGTVTATGGAAADLRMPSADVARVGAVRRAEASAKARLERALAELPAGAGRKLEEASVARALGRACVTGTDYQSNGGALVHLTVRFADWIDAAPEANAAPAVVLSVATMPLGAAPVAKLEGEARERPLGAAVYRVGPPPVEAQALEAKLDRAGRLTFAARDKAFGEKVAKGTALIYVRKLWR